MQRKLRKLGFDLDASHTAALLPPIWQTIYSEAIVGNHLLFARGDVHTFQSETLGASGEEANFDKAEELGARILATPTLAEMRDLVAETDIETRQHLFAIYRRFVDGWSSYLRKNLN